MGSTVARRTRNVCFLERLVSVPDRHLSRNIIYQGQHHSTSANNVKTKKTKIVKNFLSRMRLARLF